MESPEERTFLFKQRKWDEYKDSICSILITLKIKNVLSSSSNKKGELA